MILTMLSLYRRHEKNCPHSKRSQLRCQCPVWIDGKLNGKRKHHTLDTRDMVTARQMLTRIESGPGEPIKIPPLAEMVAA